MNSEDQVCRMKTFVVSRHPGALDWLAERGIVANECWAHMQAKRLRPGDRMIGTLPLHLACWVCEQGAEYWHLSLDVPVQWRGQELTAAQMEHCGARLERFSIQRVPGTLLLVE